MTTPPNKETASKRKPRTWGDIYRAALRRGDDHGYAAFLAYEHERRQERKKKQDS